MRLVTIAVIGIVAAAAPAASQSDANPVVARDSGAAMHRLADGVFVIIHDDAVHTFPDGSTNWPHGNVGVVVGDRAILVIDSDFFPSRAAADIALIRRVSDKPVGYLVNTHWHGDHTHGNAVYKRAFPSLEIVGARANAHFISLNQARYARAVTAEGSAVRRDLARHEQLLASGVDSAGKGLSDAERSLLTRIVGQERVWLEEFAKIEVAPPTRLFDSSTTLDLGGTAVHLRNWGRANSPADVTVWVPRARALFTGDILVYPVPYVFGAYPGPWIGVLKAVEAIPARSVVPGHGPVFQDHSYTRLVRELFEVTQSRMDSLLRLGRSGQEAQALLDLSDYRPRFVREGDTNAAAYWAASIRAGLVERTFQCVMGSRC